MTSRVITNTIDRAALVRFIETRQMPFTIEIVPGKRRSIEQNKLQRRVINTIAEQTGQTAEEVRGYCKLTIGVPILRAENELFALKYDETIKGLPYETKLAIMQEPLDLPITRLMTTPQKTRYLDGVMRHFSEQGVVFNDARAA
jgi:hypothetical protein